MKKLAILAAGVLVLGSFTACNQKGGSNAASTPLTDSASMAMGEFMGNALKMDSTLNVDKVMKGIEYAMAADTDQAYMTGVQVGMQLAQQLAMMQERQHLTLDKNKVLSTLKSVLKKGDRMNQDDMMALRDKVDKIMNRAVAEARQNSPEAIAAKKASEEYLKKMEGNKDFQKSKSGIYYKIEKEGTGANFTEEDEIMVKYNGRHVDGDTFDMAKEPRPFRIAQVVPGFGEMLKMMKPGSKATVVIPAELAYGVEGKPNPMTGDMVIQPNEALIFDIETVSATKAADKPKPGPGGPRPGGPKPGAPAPRH